jgi:methionyl-tRNA formyltransferase
MKLALLTYESPQSTFLVRSLLDAFPGQIQGIVRSDSILRGRGTLWSVRYMLKRSGPGFVVPKGAEIVLSQGLAGVLRLFGIVPPLPTLAHLGATHGVPVIGTADVNAPETLATLQSWRPDLVLSVYLNHKIGPALLAIPTAGVLNVHGALLPRNRGLFPYFWALVNGDRETGVTVHWVDAQLDTGDIVSQEALAITAEDSVSSVSWRCTRLAAGLLARTVRAVEAGTAPRIRQDTSLATYHSWPTREAMRVLRRRGRRYGSLAEAWRSVMPEPALLVAPEAPEDRPPAL